MTVDSIGGNQQVSEPASGVEKLSAILRYIGISAVLLAATIYMLQGTENLAIDLRQWVVLMLIGAMGACGYITRIHFDDVKGARALFSLAIVLIPVQFSQLGGMVFELVSGTQVSAETFWQPASEVSLQRIIGVLAVSLLLSIPYSYAAFSMLARRRVATLVGVFLLANLTILLPFRASSGSFAVICGLIAVMVFVRRKVFSRHSIFRTLEGKLLQALFGLPVLIMGVRDVFHIDSLAGFTLIGGALGVFMMYAFPVRGPSSLLREACVGIGGVFVSVAWWVFVIETPVLSDQAAVVSMFPLALLFTELSRLSSAARVLYRNLACLTFLLTSISSNLYFEELSASLATISFAIFVVSYGVVFNLKMPILTGVFAGALGVISLLAMSVDLSSFNIWLVLAVAGIVILVFSSFVQRWAPYLMSIVRQVKAYD